MTLKVLSWKYVNTTGSYAEKEGVTGKQSIESLLKLLTDVTWTVRGSILGKVSQSVATEIQEN